MGPFTWVPDPPALGGLEEESFAELFLVARGQTTKNWSLSSPWPGSLLQKRPPADLPFLPGGMEAGEGGKDSALEDRPGGGG